MQNQRKILISKENDALWIVVAKINVNCLVTKAEVNKTNSFYLVGMVWRRDKKDKSMHIVNCMKRN